MGQDIVSATFAKTPSRLHDNQTVGKLRSQVQIMNDRQHGYTLLLR
jgi:hypothetical protein